MFACVHCPFSDDRASQPAEIVAAAIVHYARAHRERYAREEEALWMLLRRLHRQEPWPRELLLPGES